jgi:copper chaperone CopZ
MNESVAKYHVGGVDCAASAREVEAAVARLPGVTGVDVSIQSATMLVRHQGQLPTAAIDHTVKWLGHAISPSPQILVSREMLQAVQGQKSEHADQHRGWVLWQHSRTH